MDVGRHRAGTGNLETVVLICLAAAAATALLCLGQGFERAIAGDATDAGAHAAPHRTSADLQSSVSAQASTANAVRLMEEAARAAAGVDGTTRWMGRALGESDFIPFLNATLTATDRPGDAVGNIVRRFAADAHLDAAEPTATLRRTLLEPGTRTRAFVRGVDKLRTLGVREDTLRGLVLIRKAIDGWLEPNELTELGRIGADHAGPRTSARELELLEGFADATPKSLRGAASRTQR
ncbi:MAG: hypothetical protein KC417_16100, partial [Myxococcales bacterium]|nr:hypothetical protein [Myxococcales bacterium]